MIKRINKSSFRLKSAHTVEISPCGKYLAQVQSGMGITIWDIELRQVINQCKLIKHDSYLGFGNDSTLMFAKNTNGELTFFETFTGNVISETGRYKQRREGSSAAILGNSKQLFDGDWNGNLILWDIDSAIEISRINFPNHMVTGIQKSLQSNNYFALICPQDTLMNMGNNGCKLLTFNEPINLEQPVYIKPNEKELRKHRHWRSISLFSVDVLTDFICICLDRENLEDKQKLVRYDFCSHQTQSIKLNYSNEYMTSLASNGTHILAVVHTNLYTKGMSPQEYLKLNEKTPTEHIHIYECDGLKRVIKVMWENLGQIKFNPNGKGLALAADKNSVYLDDYSILLGKE